MHVFVGLGVNLGDREEQLRRAVAKLCEILTDMQCSPVYESAALLPENASVEWDRPFLNMVAAGQTTLSPRELLAWVKRCEQELGRQVRGHWGPREIDMDILAYGDVVVNEPDLIIPHAGLLQRDFALIPLADIAPKWQYPVHGEFFGNSAQSLALRLHSGLRKTEISIR